MESVNSILSFESRILIDNLAVGGPTTLKIALELRVKFHCSNNVTMVDDGY